LRKQYYFRDSPDGLLAWDVDRLVELTRDFPVHAVPIDEIGSLDEPVFGEDEPSTWRAFVAHVRLLQDAELKYPIIIAADGAVMDGRHRVARALLEGRASVDAVQFHEDPSPDYVDCNPDELPY
jgi:hypothetical protein